jgi:hypothetical protein
MVLTAIPRLSPLGGHNLVLVVDIKANASDPAPGRGGGGLRHCL